MKYIVIENWNKYQSLLRRRPPWIKLHTSVIDPFNNDGKPNPFYQLSSVAKLTVMLTWVLASHNNGVIMFESWEQHAQKIGVLSAIPVDEILKSKLIRVVTNPFKLKDKTKIKSKTKSKQIKNEIETKPLSQSTDIDIDIDIPPTPLARGKRGQAAPFVFEIPSELDRPEFRKAWEDRLQSCREAKKKITPTAGAAQLEQCRQWGFERAVAAVRHSISYQGLYESGNGSKPTASHLRPEEQPSSQEKKKCLTCGALNGNRWITQNGKPAYYCAEHMQGQAEDREEVAPA